MRITDFGWISDYRCRITDNNGQVVFTDVMRVFASPRKTAEGHRPPVLMLFEKIKDEQVYRYSVIAKGLRGSVLSYQWQYRAASGEWIDETDGIHFIEENTSKEGASVIQYKITDSNTPTMLKEIPENAPMPKVIYRCVIRDEEGNTVITDEL